jgi:uncharacterized secreted protein with C-terminal beta-propeller domain
MNHTLRLMLVSVVLASLWLAALIGFVATKPSDSSSDGLLKTFDSKDELVKFLANGRNTGANLLLPKFSADNSERSTGVGSAVPHSETNVQTAGVDEVDVVKTDGEYIYIATNSVVRIVKATPPEQMEIISTIEARDILGLDDSASGYICGLFLRDDKLIVLGGVYSHTSQYRYFPYPDGLLAKEYDYEPPRAVVSVFDVSDKSDPERELLVGISGSHMTARMVGDVVYLLAQLSVWYADEDNVMPLVWEDGDRGEVPLSTVKYDPEMRYADSFVNILALDISDGGHGSLSIVADWSSTIYMSTESLYFAVQKWEGGVADDIGAVSPEDTDTAKTTIYKISTEGVRMTDSARGDVKGWLLNQFSMDEYDGRLRVATTTGWRDAENAVYVLDGDLRTIGALEGLAPTERIYSARFVGETLYLVTFLQVDPLFIIDLSNPASPKVAGELKIPGFSTYLHPVDDSHVLGIGQENGSVKVSLFDVSDPTAPSEQSKLVIGGFYSSSALYDHKAVLFDLERELLVLPGYDSGTTWSDWNYTYYCNPVAYVLRVSLSDGISLRGVISHKVTDDVSYGQMERSLYIGDCLYTLSNLALQANLLEDLSFVGKVTLDEHWGYGYYYF